MKIKFLGAAREVTGSQYLLTVNGEQILLECGLYQGHRDEAKQKNTHFQFDPTAIRAVILSHAHIDHSGNLPNLVKQGFTGPIFATHATRDLCAWMLRDSGFIAEKDAEYWNERHPTEQIEALYTVDDADATLGLFEGIGYNHWVQVIEGVELCYLNAGHILGAGIVILKVTENGKTITFGFTGDLGRKDLPILKDPEQVTNLDYFMTESTYGDRLHDPIKSVREDLKQVVLDAIHRKGKIIIPAFAVERTQEIVYTLHLLKDAGEIPEIPIFVDSPLAANVTEVFRNHPECFDDETKKEFLVHQENPFGFGGLHYTRSQEESMELNEKEGPMIIISASGMCEHGRILHHLKNNIENPNNVILIVGFQAHNTLGRRLVEKETVVPIFGKQYQVKAQVKIMNSFSAHADRDDLIRYASAIKGVKKIFLVHGEENGALALQQSFKDIGLAESVVPRAGDEYELN